MQSDQATIMAAQECDFSARLSSGLTEVVNLINAFLNKLGIPPDYFIRSSACQSAALADLHSKVFYEHLECLCAGLQEQVMAGQNAQQAKQQKVNSSGHDTSAVSLDPTLVQVTADKTEIDRRIAAFVQRKQNDVDLQNKREFCSMVDDQSNNDFSCARVDAEFIPRFGQKSHIKVTRVDNTSSENEAHALSHVSGRQQTGTSRKMKVMSQMTVDLCNQSAVTGRLVTMETHLGICPGRPVPPDVYQRLRTLEERILTLEGLSPEYFQDRTSGAKTSSPRKPVFSGLTSREQAGQTSQTSHGREMQGLSLQAIDDRINTLKRSLARSST